MTGQVFCSTVVDNICTMLEGPLECRAHHGIVHDDKSIGTALLDVLCDASEIDYLQERVRRRLKEDHGNVVLGMKKRSESGRVGRIDMVYGDALVSLEVIEKAICTTVEVIACDDSIGRLEETEDCVEGSHARGYGKGMGC